MTQTAQDYLITTKYGYTGPPYSSQHPHPGNDRKMEIGVPVLICKTVIGYSGNTGSFNGIIYQPHLHTQAGSDQACQKTVDPTPYEFKPGTVVATGTGPQWGKFVTIRTQSGTYITYAHLSQITVTVGQIIEGESMATDKLTREEVQSNWLLAYFRDASEGDKDFYEGKPLSLLQADMHASKLRGDVVRQYEAGGAVQDLMPVAEVDGVPTLFAKKTKG